jgi:predicted peptidase
VGQPWPMPWSNLTHHDAAIGTTLSTLPYYLYTPSRALDSVHLVTWLHGGIFSSGPAKQRLDLMAHTFAALDNCYVLHPIAPAGVNWLGYYRNHPGVVRRFDEPVTPLMKQLMQLIEHVRGTALPSARRGLLIVGGASMGGYATWDLISRHPRLVDVALPMCGGGDFSSLAVWARDEDLGLPCAHRSDCQRGGEPQHVRRCRGVAARSEASRVHLHWCPGLADGTSP